MVENAVVGVEQCGVLFRFGRSQAGIINAVTVEPLKYHRENRPEDRVLADPPERIVSAALLREQQRHRSEVRLFPNRPFRPGAAVVGAGRKPLLRGQLTDLLPNLHRNLRRIPQRHGNGCGGHIGLPGQIIQIPGFSLCCHFSIFPNVKLIFLFFQYKLYLILKQMSIDTENKLTNYF